jgi:hypothetical protein
METVIGIKCGEVCGKWNSESVRSTRGVVFGEV